SRSVSSVDDQFMSENCLSYISLGLVYKEMRLPKALLDRLTLDGKPLVEQPGWANEEQPDIEVRDTAEIAIARRQKQLWRDSGLIGCFEGEEDLSTNYKQYIAEYLDKKFPQHPLPEE
ncbi:MAG: hypothetical protein BWK73_41715, partial [Thiothrix lacustris]